MNHDIHSQKWENNPSTGPTHLIYEKTSSHCEEKSKPQHQEPSNFFYEKPYAWYESAGYIIISSYGIE
jgi:hypothetical protein